MGSGRVNISGDKVLRLENWIKEMHIFKFFIKSSSRKTYIYITGPKGSFQQVLESSEEVPLTGLS